jgi:hypothetical protein
MIMVIDWMRNFWNKEPQRLQQLLGWLDYYKQWTNERAYVRRKRSVQSYSGQKSRFEIMEDHPDAEHGVTWNGGKWRIVLSDQWSVLSGQCSDFCCQFSVLSC